MNLRAAVIGLGHMGRNHARVLASGIDGVELVAAMDTQGDRFGVARHVPVYASVAELIEHGIDYAVVSVPTRAHERWPCSWHSRSAHPHREAPGPDSGVGPAHQEAFAGTGLVAGVGHVERFNPALRQMRSRIALVNSGPSFRSARAAQGPFPARIADVGVVADLAAHDIDLTAWLTDSAYCRSAPSRPTRVGANTRT